MSRRELGDCFKTAATLVISQPERLTLCHGTVWHEETGYHSHAWAERYEEMSMPYEDQVIEWTMLVCIDKANGNDVEMPAQMYYAIGRIDEHEVRRYTFTEAARLMVDTKHYGPWLEVDE